LCFSDGRRKVDYVLVFHQRRHSSIRSPASVSASHEMLSVVSNGNFPSTASDVEAVKGGGTQQREVPSAREVFVEVRGNEPAEPAFHEMRMIREEFEANLLEAGLEIERDSERGVDVNEGEGNIRGVRRSDSESASQSIRQRYSVEQKAKTHGPSYTRLHAPWPVLCREAEFLKIKVPTKTSYKLKEESGFGSRMSTVWRKLNQPFQPKVPHQDQESTKFLSHCFSRDKLHLYNITSKDTFFDNATRGRIVYEILRRTVCVRTCQTIGISTLIAKGVYDSAFPLHDVSVRSLKSQFAENYLKRASPLPLCFCNSVDSRSRHAPFHYLCDEMPNTPCWSRCVCVCLCLSAVCPDVLSKFFFAFASPQGDFAVVGHVEEKNDRQVLHEEWARYSAFYKYQPIDLVRKYFGEKIGLYFAWLGVYTQLLIPASIVGIIVFGYGMATMNTNIPSQEMCDDSLNFTMCPLCDGACDYWHLSTACGTARASHLFDNPGTVFFAIFMSLWAVLFLEQWKRRQISLSFSWDLTGIEEDEEHPRPKYETILLQKRQRKQTKKKHKKKTEPEKQEDGTVTGKDRWRQKLLSAMGAGLPAAVEKHDLEMTDWLDTCINVSSILFMFGLTFSAVFGVIIYRITVSALMAMSPDPEIKSNVRVTVTATAVIINLVVILILDEIYGSVALWLTELEIPKTETNFEERLILKAFLLKFMNAYAPIFYVAFFKGRRFAGRPGNYVYVFNDYRMEECAPGGCLIELCIQLSIIMLGKQLIQNNIFEIGIPKLKKLLRELKNKNPAVAEREEERPPQQWRTWTTPWLLLRVSPLNSWARFGFVSLFVASFPLAPLFALLNNVIEIRLDAKKFVTELRRPVAVRAKDIGIWYNILSGMGKFSVIINAFVISFTSDFIPRLVYQYVFSQTGTMHGFIDHTLSHFNVSNFKPGTAPQTSELGNITVCRYKDYREPPWSPEAYAFSKHYWCVLAARLAFVILFQNLVMFLSLLVAWVIPDVPKTIVEQLKREKKLLVDVFLQEEKEKFQLIQTLFSKDP
ncbi:unnamed protein product, partial [Tetraodon nigroviridis]